MSEREWRGWIRRKMAVRDGLRNSEECIIAAEEIEARVDEWQSRAETAESEVASLHNALEWLNANGVRVDRHVNMATGDVSRKVALSDDHQPAAGFYAALSAAIGAEINPGGETDV